MVGQELVGVEHAGQQRLHPVPADERQQPPLADPALLPRRDERGEVRAVVQEPVHAALEVGERLEELGLDRLDRQERDQPDQRAHLERDELAGIEMEHVVEELVLRIPQRRRFHVDAVESAGDVQEVLEELRRDVLVHGVVARQLQRDRQHAERVEAHPRRAVRLADVAGDRERRGPVEHADVVQPEEAALEDVAALRVLAVDPPGEVEQQLLEDPARGSRGPACRSRAGRSCRRARAAQAWTGGLTSENAHSYAGSWPLGCWYHSRVSSSSWSLAKSGSTSASGSMWKARSQAANHGYSQASGMDRTSIVLSSRQSALRPDRRASGGGGPAGSPSSHFPTS